MIKQIFFDIDDTLCRLGRLPEYNAQLLQALHQRGIHIAIATGRGLSMLPPDIEALFTAGLIEVLVSMNGQFNRVGEKVVSCYPLSSEDISDLIALCQKYRVHYQQVGEKHIAWSADMRHYDAITASLTSCIIDPDYYQKFPVYQLSVFLPESQSVAQIYQSFTEKGYYLLPWRGGADVLPHQASKARGVFDICQALSWLPEETMAFGDGVNDIEMLQAVGIGVAMGDAGDELKAVADYVTGTVEENGILQALQHYKILPI
ncbi:HAD family hydrolase [Dichelobacter nodosus]|uniref:Haloacid dehalogenase-like hydrolase, COF family n=1 Tax=Dichelobacter nodosus (strain VCS1703A) TaxID=246195 RepID=A5EWQ8_DICNV|nr:HAD family hydrolase [Dichelobacter nodosus]ABQ14279.1 haloacid dehalogenase-like hydrolase, COF family [Dichelobacter nodosus VCS1703A]AXM45049.1 HAD family hydrolase [Dichelobacter nodosus]